MSKRLLVFASGSKDGGGSGFENLVTSPDLQTDAEFVGVVSNHENGGVRERADRLGIPFIYFDGPWTAEEYQKIVNDTCAEFVALSGWLKIVTGLNPATTINIHPGPLPRFGGKNMYGHYVHEAVHEAYQAGEVTHSAVSMHFVTEKYDEGPLFFSKKTELSSDDTPDTIFRKVNDIELAWQPKITAKILRDEISWDGKNPETLVGAEID